MTVSLKPSHLRRYKDVAKLLMKYGRGDVVKASGLDDDPDAALVPEVAEDKKPEQLAADLEKMGPTFIKLGQLLSTRGDLLPQAYLDALTRLQDDVKPFPSEEVEQIVQEELGVRLSKAFLTFEHEPLAAASLGQVHRATLRDGRPVVVKVQRPGIRQQMIEDLEALAEMASMLDKHTRVGKRYEFGAMIEEFRKTLMAELDYRLEARNLEELACNLEDFSRLIVPRPVADYSTARVLTMDYIGGKKITSLSPLAFLEVDGPGLAEELFHGYLKQIFVDGFFHADPHPGNVFLTEDGRIALLDLGMVARLSPRLQEHLLQMLLAVSEGRSDETADFAIMIGDKREDFDERAFRRRVSDAVGRTQGATLEQHKVGRVFVDMARYATDAGLRLPPDLTVLGKTLLNLDGIGRLLAPDFEPAPAVQRHASRIMRQRMLKSLSAGNVYSGVLELKDLVNRLPARVNRILDNAATGQMGLKIDTGIDAPQLMVSLQKVANRITVGLVIAALIIGAAMLMQVPTHFTIWGYPGLAMIFFLAAVAGGLMLLYEVLWKDIRNSKANVGGKSAANPAKPV